uniref:ATP synthase subunit a n=1 Tax=Polyplax asiatica TaxID=1425297 RepID=V9PXD2_9NEOP|nr:ATP synthase subunit 6 [Polyplax asiatica]
MSSMMSIFDPSLGVEGLSVKWIWGLAPFLLLSGGFWALLSGVTGVLSMFGKQVSNSVLPSLKEGKPLALSLMGVYMVLLTMNLLSLSPFSFCPPSHLSFGLSVCFPLWVGGLISSYKKSKDKFLSHFLPLGTPQGLSWFLVLIELTSQAVRPLSLSVRLMANLTAGHMIMSLAEKASLLFPLLFKLQFLMILSLLLVFEFGVALIQAYVFMSLLSLYWDEGSH